MNSMIQALSGSQILIGEVEAISKESKDGISKELYNLLKGINKGDTDCTEKLEKFAKLAKWNKQSQQDSFDLLTSLIKAMQEDAGHRKVKIPLKLEVVYSYKNGELEQRQEVVGLSLALEDEKGGCLERMVESYFKVRYIDGNQGDPTWVSLADSPPEVLLIHIQANEWDARRQTMVKPEYSIKYQEKMTFKFEVNVKSQLNSKKQDTDKASRKTESCGYKLVSIVTHYGSRTGGHYVAWRKFEDVWYRMNDNNAKEKEELDCTTQPYVMLFEKIGPGPIGLRNTGQNCYMNSMIQALSGSQILIGEVEAISKESKDGILKELYNLLKGVNKGDTDCTEKLEKVTKLAKWNKQSQQDSFDLLTSLIKAMQEVAGHRKVKIPLKLEVVYFYKNGELEQRQKVVGLSLVLEDKKHGGCLERMVESYFKVRYIDGNQGDPTWVFLADSLPEVLLIHIQANEWDTLRQTMVKPKYSIKYQEKMTFKFEVNVKSQLNSKKQDTDKASRKTESCGYKLVSIVTHYGSRTGGHYVVWRKFEDVWYRMNDNNAKEKEELDCTTQPYVMLFEKIGPEP